MSQSSISRVEADALIRRHGGVEHDGVSVLLQRSAYVLRDGRVVVMDRENAKQPVAMLWDNMDELIETYGTLREEEVVVSDVISSRFPSAKTFIRQIDDWIIRLQEFLSLEQPIVLRRDCVRKIDDRFEKIGEQCLDDAVVFCGLTALIGTINCKVRNMQWGTGKYGSHIVPANINVDGRVEFPFDGLLRIEDGALWAEDEGPSAFRPIEFCTHGWSLCLP